MPNNPKHKPRKNDPVRRSEDDFQRPIVHVKLKRTKKQWAKVLNEDRKTSQRAIYTPNE